MKLGILGSGNIVNSFLRDLKDKNNFDIVAICGREQSKDKLKALSTDYNIEKLYYNYDEMLNDDEIDTIYVALPNSMHYKESLKALELGKHVICEKPFTTSLKELEHLNKVATDNNVFIFEAIIPIHLPNYHAIRESVKDLGTIKIVQLDFSQYSSRYDLFRNGETPIAFDTNYSGGALMDLNIYNLHFVIGIWGMPLKAIYHPNMERGIDTSGIIIMDYSGFKASLIASKDCKAPPSGKILGTDGLLTVNSATSMCRSFTVTMNNNIDNPNTIDLNEFSEIMVPEFNNFAKYIDNKDSNTYRSLMSHSLDVMKICEKIRLEANIIFKDDK